LHEEGSLWRGTDEEGRKREDKEVKSLSRRGEGCPYRRRGTDGQGGRKLGRRGELRHGFPK